MESVKVWMLGNIRQAAQKHGISKSGSNVPFSYLQTTLNTKHLRNKQTSTRVASRSTPFPNIRPASPSPAAPDPHSSQTSNAANTARRTARWVWAPLWRTAPPSARCRLLRAVPKTRLAVRAAAFGGAGGTRCRPRPLLARRSHPRCRRLWRPCLCCCLKRSRLLRECRCFRRFGRPRRCLESLGATDPSG